VGRENVVTPTLAKETSYGRREKSTKRMLRGKRRGLGDGAVLFTERLPHSAGRVSGSSRRKL